MCPDEQELHMALSLTDFLLTHAQVTYVGGVQDVHGMAGPIGSSTIPIATTTVDLDPGEYFTSISGTPLNYTATPMLTRGLASLTFSTNKRGFGPFGFPNFEKPFQIQGPVYAFHGAVARGDTNDVLSALGCWRVPAGKELSQVANADRQL